jgi:hypothetical protein
MIEATARGWEDRDASIFLTLWGGAGTVKMRPRLGKPNEFWRPHQLRDIFRRAKFPLIFGCYGSSNSLIR